MNTNTSGLEKFFILLSILGGSLILFIPVQKLLIALIALIIFFALAFKPKICFYTMLVLSTYTPALGTEGQQFPFNQTDILISICFMSTFCRFLFIDNAKINLKTKLDGWLLMLLAVYFFAGFTSISHRGYQGFLRMGEIIAVFYMTVYFLRTKVIKLSELITVMLATGVVQGLYATLQSLTGGFGTNFQSNRGYLGTLGIGSPMVWHGHGTFPHFNTLGPFLSNLFLFFLPLNIFIAKGKNKKKGWFVLSIILLGIFKTYSRGVLISVILACLFFMFQMQKDKVKFLLKLIPPSILMGVAWIFIKNSSYMSTISPRNEMWELARTAITQSPKTLLMGYGLSAYRDAVWPFLPMNIPITSYDDYLAHSFYLYNMVELGLVGLLLLISFLFKNIAVAYKNLKTRNKTLYAISMGTIMVIISLFVEGIFDMGFNHFVIQLWLFLILGIMYSKMYKKKRLV